MIISISEVRLKRVFADIHDDAGVATDDGQFVVIGQVISDQVGVWTQPEGTVVKDVSGHIWLQRRSHDELRFVAPIPDAYLASSVESFKQVAALNCEAGKLATLPRSQHFRFVEAERYLREWVKWNDHQCFADPGSYWNEIWRAEY